MIWKGIKQIVHCKPPISQRSIKLVENGNEKSDPKEVANKFNDYFANIGKSIIASEIPIACKDPMAYLGNPVCNSFYLFPNWAGEIETEINNLKSGKSSGPSSIPVNILKLTQHVVSKPLEIIFNASFASGVVPNDFKLANVIPVFKKGSQYSLCNYRPISLLSVFNKLLEKLIYNRLINFIDKNSIFFNKQFGFRAKHSTNHAILCIIDRIQKAIDDRNYSCGIFLDFSKAFDTINHNILIRKLQHYGVRGLALDWFISYLSNRNQVVTVNGVQSELLSISCGIPQGSVLGPILFLLYINDFHKCSKLFDFHLFADDANLFYENKNVSVLETTVNAELNRVYDWLCANMLSLNIQKSNYVIFHPPQRNIRNLNINLMINEVQMKRESCVTYLGVLIDSTLSWKNQVEYVSKKIRRSIGILCKLRYFVTKDILINLYYALIYPFLIYGLISWGNTYESNLKPIYTLQKRALRIITFSAFDHPSSPLFKSLGITKFFDLVTYHIAVLMYKYHNSLLPSAFNCFFMKISQVHSYNTRLAVKQTYYLPNARTNYGMFNIRFKGPKVWNDLDENIKGFSLPSFKNKLKQSFLESY